MKGIALSLSLIAAVSWMANAQQKSSFQLKADSLQQVITQMMGSDSIQIMVSPEINFENTRYSMLVVPNQDNRYFRSPMHVKKPTFEPYMPVRYPDPFDQFYLLDLDPVIVTPTKDH